MLPTRHTEIIAGKLKLAISNFQNMLQLVEM